MSSHKLNKIAAMYQSASASKKDKLKKEMRKEEAKEKPSDESKESPKAQKLEKKLGIEKHK